MRVIALDPGLANTGAVFSDHGEIVRAETWTTPSGGSHAVDFADCLKRVRVLEAALRAALFNFRPDVVVIESYRDFGGGHKREVANRWTTPLLLGYFLAFLLGCGVTVVFQDPATVMAATASTRTLWKSKGTGIIHGEKMLTNDHLRSAGGHLLYYLGRRK